MTSFSYRSSICILALSLTYATFSTLWTLLVWPDITSSFPPEIQYSSCLSVSANSERTVLRREQRPFPWSLIYQGRRHHWSVQIARYVLRTLIWRARIDTASEKHGEWKGLSRPKEAFIGCKGEPSSHVKLEMWFFRCMVKHTYSHKIGYADVESIICLLESFLLWTNPSEASAKLLSFFKFLDLFVSFFISLLLNNSFKWRLSVVPP